jgi:hypothetical protein
MVSKGLNRRGELATFSRIRIPWMIKKKVWARATYKEFESEQFKNGELRKIICTDGVGIFGRKWTRALVLSKFFDIFEGYMRYNDEVFIRIFEGEPRQPTS